MRDSGGKGDVIDFYDELDPLEKAVDDTAASVRGAAWVLNGETAALNALIARTERLTEQVPVVPALETPNLELMDLNRYLEQRVPDKSPANVKPFPGLTTEEIIFSAVAGLIATAIDVIFVGTPEIVKVYKGGEHFDGSIFTDLIRKIGAGPEGKGWPILQWLSDHCKVPYDISARKGVVIPNNHRLRSLAHDPFFGLLFAVADIIMGTTTCIDNEGHLRILINSRPVPMSEKILSVFFYIGHILSDLFTARGIPIPGFFLTQFFTAGGSDGSLARTAERMYLDGYDMRHLASMAVPVFIMGLMIDAYLSFEDEPGACFSPVAEREYGELARRVKRARMIFLSDAVAAGGNAVKFFAPPNCGNPCGLNAAQWFALVRSSIRMIRIEAEDRSAETLIVQRREINRTWARLLEDF